MKKLFVIAGIMGALIATPALAMAAPEKASAERHQPNKAGKPGKDRDPAVAEHRQKPKPSHNRFKRTHEQHDKAAAPRRHERMERHNPPRQRATLSTHEHKRRHHEVREPRVPRHDKLDRRPIEHLKGHPLPPHAREFKQASSSRYPSLKPGQDYYVLHRHLLLVDRHTKRVLDVIGKLPPEIR